MQATFDKIQASTLGEGGLPNEVYTSDGFFKWERDHLFASRWFGIGFSADVPEPGDIHRVDVLGASLLIVRGDDQQIRVFHNVCRHRGRQLLDEPCTRAKLIRCPYHSWTYRLDGTLSGTPHIGGSGVHTVDNFDKSRFTLYEIAVSTWLDVVFINLDGQAGPFENFIKPLVKRLERLWGTEGPAGLTPARDGFTEMEVKSNWKLAVENYLEAYHLPIVHPVLNRYSPLSQHYAYHDAADFAGQGVTSYRPVINGAERLPILSGWKEELKHTAEYPSVYPNVLIGVQHDHVFTMLLLPLASDRTLERVELQFIDEGATDNAFTDTRSAILEGWRGVFLEDVSAVEGMQYGRYSQAFDGGVFTPVLDLATRHFHRWYAQHVNAKIEAT
ncbi:MAG: (2Fe-2S)-binding protein [marine bacterium B5-7]|nr:MAG: (2Fe-2S)-binding protein [marine bacterium B5-7]